MHSNDHEHEDDSFIEVGAPEIDAAEIMRRIRENIERKRQQGLLPDQRFPRFGLATAPAEPTGEHDVDLYYHLRRANETCQEVGVTLTLAPSPATSIPILGKLWSLIRRQMHELVLFYIAALSRAQTRVNGHLVSTLNRVVAESQRQAEEIATLRREVERLRQEMSTKR